MPGPLRTGNIVGDGRSSETHLRSCNVDIEKEPQRIGRYTKPIKGWGVWGARCANNAGGKKRRTAEKPRSFGDAASELT